jgi:hypothetical protein
MNGPAERDRCLFLIRALGRMYFAADTRRVRDDRLRILSFGFQLMLAGIDKNPQNIV